MAETHRSCRLLLGTLSLVALALAATPWDAARAFDRAADARGWAAPRELIVQYDAEVAPAQARAFERLIGAKALAATDSGDGRLHAELGGGRLARLQVPDGSDPDVFAAQLRGTRGIAGVQPNFLYHATRTPPDPDFNNGRLWGLNKIGAPAAWDSTTGSPNVVVGVVDTGVDYNHPDLAANIWRNSAEATGRSGVDDDGNGYVDDVYGFNAMDNNGNVMDENGHGTHVSGTIGAASNSTGVVGVNWQTSIMALRFLDAEGYGDTFDAVRCMDYALKAKDRGVNVVALNCSWGGEGYDSLLYNMMDRLNGKGILVACAAGNGDDFGRPINNDTSAAKNYPSSYNLPNIIAVTATDSGDRSASWANYGATTVDLAAPGVGILSTTPGNVYSTYSGTSMATPHVTGAIALLKAQNFNLTAAQVRDLILQNVDPIAALKGRCVTGGRLNLAKAMAKAGGNGTPPPTPTPTPTPNPSLVLRVASINLQVQRQAGRFFVQTRATATVSVVDGSGKPVSAALVAGRFSGAANQLVTGSTNSRGQVSFTTAWVPLKAGSSYVFTVNNVTKKGYTYQPQRNGSRSVPAR